MMNQTYSYRKGTASDSEQLKQLALLSYGQNRGVLGEENWAMMKNNLSNEGMFQQLLKTSDCFVCEDQGKIIGMAFLIPKGNPTDFFEKEWSYIRLIGVDPSYGGKGIGRKLTEQCVVQAIKNGEAIVALHTSEFQNAARHIYESLGFKQMKELDTIYSKRYWLYKLDLGNSLNQITYRRATFADVETLIDLRIGFAIALGGEREATLIQKLKLQLHSYFQKSFSENTSIWYLAGYNNKAVGIGGVMIREQPGNFMNPGGLFGYVINMFTLPEFRRRKICGTILEMLVKAAARKGVAAFELHATKEGEFVYRQREFKIHDEPTYRRYINS